MILKVDFAPKLSNSTSLYVLNESKKIFNKTTFSVYLPYIAGHSLYSILYLCLISKKPNVLNLQSKIAHPSPRNSYGGGGSKELQKEKLQYKRMDTNFQKQTISENVY